MSEGVVRLGQVNLCVMTWFLSLFSRWSIHVACVAVVFYCPSVRASGAHEVQVMTLICEIGGTISWGLMTKVVAHKLPRNHHGGEYM